jgi:Protein of unknown function (DUF3592)
MRLPATTIESTSMISYEAFVRRERAMNAVVPALIFGLIAVVAFLAWMFWKLRSPSLLWPATEARFEHAEISCIAPRTRPGFEASPCWICTLEYTYQVNGREYRGKCKCAVSSENQAQRMAEMKIGESVRIRYSVDSPRRSFLDHQSEASLNRAANLLRLGEMNGAGHQTSSKAV